MEAHANGVDDVLVDGLSYKLRNGAKYITDRRSVTFHPSGSNVYRTSSGTKVLKIVLTGDSWLVPGSVRLMYTLRNNDSNRAKRLRTLSGPWSFWRRIRVLCGGQVVEDFDLNRTQEMMQLLHSESTRDNDDVEGIGYRANTREAPSTLALPGIAGGEARRVSFRLLSGLLSQPKWLPIRYCPVTLELELVSGATDAVVAPGGSIFTSSNTSTDWQIEDVQLKADLCTLDNAVDNQIADHLLSGKALPINYQTYLTQSQVAAGQSLSMNVSRAVTRLSSVFLSFSGPIDDPRLKEWNTFYHPMVKTTKTVTDGLTTSPVHDSAYELEYQIQIGSKLFPEYPAQSLAEAFAQLRKSVRDAYGSDFHGLSIKASEYRTCKYVVAVQTSKLLAAGFTGLNTRSGDLMTIRVKGAGWGLDTCGRHAQLDARGARIGPNPPDPGHGSLHLR